MDQSPPEGYDFQMYLNIDQVRLLYSHICYSIEMWPGSPARPAVEQEYLHQLRNQLFAMIADYSFTELDTDR